MLMIETGMRAVHPDIVLPSVDKERILAHLDHSNPNSFEIEDLAKLIRQVSENSSKYRPAIFFIVCFFAYYI